MLFHALRGTRMPKSSIFRLSRVGPMALLALAVGCDKGTGAAAGPPGGGMPPTAVTATEAIAHDVPVYIDGFGKTVATESVTISPQVSGKIIARHFDDGADIKKGQLLFELDPRPFKASLDQAKGQLAKDQATKSSADWNVGQDQAALSTKAISEQQLHNDVSMRDQAQGAIAVDQAMIESAQLNLEYCSIKSPIDGRAGGRLVDVGNVVTGTSQMNGSNLLVINKVASIYADFTVTEGELQRVQRFMKEGTLAVRVETPQDSIMSATMATLPTAPPTEPAPGKSTPADKSDAMESRPTTAPTPFKAREGKLIFLDNTVQDGTGTVKLRAELPNEDQHFWPGQFVNVRLVLTVKKDAVLVPVIATQVSQQGLFVYTVKPDDKSPSKSAAAQQMVTLGQRQGELVVVESGVAAGEKVVTTGQLTLQPGSPVMVLPPNGGAQPMGPAGIPKVDPASLKQPGTNSEGKRASAETTSGAQS